MRQKRVPTMHPALHSWRDELPAHAVRAMAYVGGLAVMSMLAAGLYQSKPVKAPIASGDRSDWIEVERPFPAFALSIPEASGQTQSYAIRRHATTLGRKDILGLGAPEGTTPYLEVSIYRAGTEIGHFPPPVESIVADATALGPVKVTPAATPLTSKFGPLTIARFETSHGAPRHCVGFARSYDDPMLQITGRFCQGEAFIAETTLSCALDRLTLLAAGSEPKIGALFAHAELGRSYCGQRDILMTATPKHRSLWQALDGRPAR